MNKIKDFLIHNIKTVTFLLLMLFIVFAFFRLFIKPSLIKHDKEYCQNKYDQTFSSIKKVYTRYYLKSVAYNGGSISSLDFDTLPQDQKVLYDAGVLSLDDMNQVYVEAESQYQTCLIKYGL